MAGVGVGYQGRERSYLTPERGSANTTDQWTSSLMHRSWAQLVLMRDGWAEGLPGQDTALAVFLCLFYCRLPTTLNKLVCTGTVQGEMGELR